MLGVAVFAFAHSFYINTAAAFRHAAASTFSDVPRCVHSSMSRPTFRTPLTALLGIQHPVVLAGMNVAAGAELAAAVTNAGGLGVIGGLGYTPKMLRRQIAELKTHLDDQAAPFGVDLLLPKVGGGARRTNYDYTKGALDELLDVLIEGGARLFVCAVGVPPRWAVDKLHAAGVLYMNMIGAPEHVPKALAAGADLLCAQGGEGGGHTGDVPTSVLLPTTVDLCRGKLSAHTQQEVVVLGAGGIFDGRGLAMALSMGAAGVWVGTRFICSVEAGAPPRHQQGVLQAGFHDTVRTTVYTGRPMRVLRDPLNTEWADNRQDALRQHRLDGTLPYNLEDPPLELLTNMPLLMGQTAAAVHTILPARTIVEEMVADAAAALQGAANCVARL